MNFEKKLKSLMDELGITQSKLSELTGIGKSSISQYLSGKVKPSAARKRIIATALGVKEDYFEQFDPLDKVSTDTVINVPIPLVARLMGKSREWVMQGLQDGVFPWGYAVKLTKWSYFVSSVKFTEYTGIEVPVKNS